MLNTLLQFDTQISVFLTGIIPHTHFFDYIFAFLSLKGLAIPIWVVIVAILMVIEEKRNKKFVLVFFVTIAFTALVVSYPLKMIFHRQRPIPNKLYSHVACPTDFSFPSGHAATAFAAATVLAVFDKKRRLFYFTVAVLISYSRIYLQCHYLLDIVGGAIIGVIIALIFLRFVKFNSHPSNASAS
jgi:undecaprenyl-diphosphatase